MQKLAGEAGVELPQYSPDDEARELKRKSLYEIVELACQFYETQLRDAAGREARDYLKTRCWMACQQNNSAWVTRPAVIAA